MVPTAVRWIAALIPIVYGFAKLNGSQFEILDSELDKPMGAVSGFWLTWYYFGYSTVYGTIIALVQIGGGLLLTFRRFELAGALLLLPVALNIVLVDIFYGVGLGATLTAIVWLVLLLWIVAPHRKRLMRAVVTPSTGGRRWPAWAGRFALVLGAIGLTYWTANYIKRAVTPIDGVWTVAPAVEAGGIERVFFERNRAHMVVMKDTAGRYIRHHFELDPSGHIRIWAEWLDRGELLFEGAYETNPEVIHLRPAGQEPGRPIELRPAGP